jgi:predicted phage terminase large subunit-like protein
LEYPDLRRAIKEQAAKYRPSKIIIEDKGSGTSLLQDLKTDRVMGLYPYCPPPGNDKPMRLYAQSAVFENGQVFLPKNASWLHEYVRELTSCPGSKYDDQVDSTTQALVYMTSISKNLAIWAALGAP